MAQWGKNLPAVQETQEAWVWFLGQEDPLGKEMATHSSVLAWETPWMEKPGRPQSMRSQRVSTSDPIWTISITYFCVRGKKSQCQGRCWVPDSGRREQYLPKVIFVSDKCGIDSRLTSLVWDIFHYYWGHPKGSRLPWLLKTQDWNAPSNWKG